MQNYPGGKELISKSTEHQEHNTLMYQSFVAIPTYMYNNRESPAQLENQIKPRVYVKANFL